MTYLDALDDHRVLVVVAGSLFLAADGPDVLAEGALHDHDLPLEAVPGDAAVLAAALASDLEEEGLALALK